MAQEIERKFLVNDASCVKGLAGTPYVQGYLCNNPMTVRVRLANEIAWLTLKGRARGLVRDEFEYEIPTEDARALLEQSGGGIPIPPEDARALADQICHLQENPALVAELGSHARRFVLERFTVEAKAAAYIDALQTVAS